MNSLPRSPLLPNQPAITRLPAARPAVLGLACSLSLCCALLRGNALAAANDTTSFWDKALLDMELQHVDIKATGLPEAWDKLGRDFLVRSVLARQWRTAIPRRPFQFNRDDCTVREVIRAMLEVYPEYQFTQDAETGILWIHPASVPYGSILAKSVVIPPGFDQVPTLQGVLRPLRAQGALDIRQRGIVEIFESGGAFPVSLRPGVATVRDVLNMCCQASPSRTFSVALDGPNAIVSLGDILNSPTPPEMDKLIEELKRNHSGGLSATNPLVESVGPGGSVMHALPVAAAADAAPARAGSLLFWRLGMGRAGEAEPTDAELLEALASPNAHERWVARSYVKSELFHVNLPAIINGAPHGRKAIWASLAELSMLNLVKPSPYMPGLKRIQREVSLGSAATLDRPTAVLAAMEMARVGDDALLKEVAQWNLSPDESSAMYPDAVRIANLSSEVRAGLREANCAWPGLSAKDLRGMEERKLLVLPQ